MLLIIYVAYVVLAVIDLVLSVIFMKLGREGNSRNERVMYTCSSVVYVVMALYFAFTGIYGIIS